MEIFNRYTMVYAAVYGQGFVASGTVHTPILPPPLMRPVLWSHSHQEVHYLEA